MARRSRDGLYRREGGIFAFRYQGENGRWREKYTGTRNRLEAAGFRDTFKREIGEGTLPNGDMAKWRLDEAEQWWIKFRIARIAANTLSSERYRLKHFTRILGNKRLGDVKSCDLDFYVTKRLEDGVGAWSINKEILLWSLILKKAKLWSRLRDDYKPLRTKASDIGRALSREQLRQLAQTAETNVDWEAAFYASVLAGNTGLRGGEIKKLRVGAIDVVRKRIIVRRTDTKSDAGARHIELNRDAVEAAQRLLLRATLLDATKPENYLMPKHLSRIAYGSEKGRRGYDPDQHQAYWDTAWKKLTEVVNCPNCGHLQAPTRLCRMAGCETSILNLKSQFVGLRFHDLRHTFITHMVERGVPLGVIQTFVGHLSARMIRHYTHVSSGAARAAVELLDKDPILVGQDLTIGETHHDGDSTVGGIQSPTDV